MKVATTDAILHPEKQVYITEEWLEKLARVISEQPDTSFITIYIDKKDYEIVTDVQLFLNPRNTYRNDPKISRFSIDGCIIEIKPKE